MKLRLPNKPYIRDSTFPVKSPKTIGFVLFKLACVILASFFVGVRAPPMGQPTF
jgi:hypothetical protein